MILGVFTFKLSINARDKNLEVITKEYKLKDKKISFDLKYPEVKMVNSEVQDKINKSIYESISSFKKNIEDIYNETAKGYPEDLFEKSSSSDFSGLSNFDYQIINNILSIKLNLFQFTGGAHPMTYVKDFNFDLSTGENLKLSDLFNEEGKKSYKEIVDKFIRDKIKENPDDYFEDGFKGIGDKVQYYLTKDHIVIFYQLYDLAPYAYGIPEFKIPYSYFKGTIINR